MKKIFLLIIVFVVSSFPQSGDVLISILSGGAQNNYNANASALFSRLTTQVSADEKARISNTCDCFKDSLGETNLSDWADLIYGFASETNEIAKLNWVKDAHNITEVSSPTWTQFKGYKGNGTSSYVNTNYATGVDAVNFEILNAAIGLYCNSLETGNILDMGSSNASNAQATRWDLSLWGSMNYRLNSTSSGNVVNAIDTAFYFMSNITSIAEKTTAFKNGVQIDQDITTASGSGFNNHDIPIGCFNNNGTPLAGYFSPRQYSFFVLSKGLTAIEVRKVTNCVLSKYLNPKGLGATP